MEKDPCDQKQQGNPYYYVALKKQQIDDTPTNSFTVTTDMFLGYALMTLCSLQYVVTLIINIG